MSIHGIGIDIVEINRIELIISRSGIRLAKRILNLTEFKQYQKNNQTARFLAKKFAIKEAAFKAFGTGIRNKLAFKQIEILKNELGKPILQLFATASTLAEKLAITNIHVTLSDERYYVCAMVIFEKNDI